MSLREMCVSVLLKLYQVCEKYRQKARGLSPARVAESVLACRSGFFLNLVGA